MRVPLSWLAEHVDIDLEPERLAERLTLLGMEVQAVERWGEDWQGVVVGEILRVAPHPRSRRNSVTSVTVGSGEPLEIVCGATNVAPGQRVPVALPGAILPGDVRIEPTEKQGVLSNGMLCSGYELRLTTDADGILILPADAPLGRPLRDLLGDTVLDVDVKPNRGDALSIIGLAREVAAITGSEVRWPVIQLVEEGEAVASRLTVAVLDPELCSRFVGRWVANVQVGPAPDRAQMRLLAAGLRPVNNVVDASNYVMLEMGKPIHAFDAAAIRDGRIIVRRARDGERLETLDHVQRELTAVSLLIADPDGPLAIAGIMGGAASEVTESTRDVVVESAVFDPVSIRRTGQRFGLRSEASLRFEKGQEARLARLGADRTAMLLAEWAGGSVAPGRVDTAPDEPTTTRLAFRPARVNRLLGTRLSADDQRAVLARVGVETTEPTGSEPIPIPIAAGERPLSLPAGSGETLEAIIPTWRRDLHIEADVAEEVARVAGYDRVPATLPASPMPAFRPSPLARRDALRETLAGAGLTEVLTHALVAPEHADLLRWPAEPWSPPRGEGASGGPPIRCRNPLSASHSVLRQQLAGSLLDVLAANERQGRPDVAIFEIGKGYGFGPEGPREWWRLAYLLSGQIGPPAWNQPARPFDLDDAKGVADLIAVRLGTAAVRYERDETGYPFHPGRAARAHVDAAGAAGTDRRSGTRMAGWLAELHPDLLAAWGLRAERVILAHLAIEGLEAGGFEPVRARVVPRVPPAERDLAWVVPESVAAAVVMEAIRAAGGWLLREVRLFDIYRGAPLADGEKSIACRLIFQAEARTLSDEEVESARGEIVAALAARVGGRPRT